MRDYEIPGRSWRASCRRHDHSAAGGARVRRWCRLRAFTMPFRRLLTGSAYPVANAGDVTGRDSIGRFLSSDFDGGLLQPGTGGVALVAGEKRRDRSGGWTTSCGRRRTTRRDARVRSSPAPKASGPRGRAPDWDRVRCSWSAPTARTGTRCLDRRVRGSILEESPMVKARRSRFAAISPRRLHRRLPSISVHASPRRSTTCRDRRPRFATRRTSSPGRRSFGWRRAEARREREPAGDSPTAQSLRFTQTPPRVPGSRRRPVVDPRTGFTAGGMRDRGGTGCLAAACRCAAALRTDPRESPRERTASMLPSGRSFRPMAPRTPPGRRDSREAPTWRSVADWDRHSHRRRNPSCARPRYVLRRGLHGAGMGPFRPLL